MGAGAAAAVAGEPLSPSTAMAQAHPAAAPQLEALETLTAAEADILEAGCARLIPTDENGPGPAEAPTARFIHQALTAPQRTPRDAHPARLAALGVHPQAAKSAPLL